MHSVHCSLHVTLKQLVVEQNGLKFETDSRAPVTYISPSFDLVLFLRKFSLGHSVYFFSKWSVLCSSEIKVGERAKQAENWDSGH